MPNSQPPFFECSWSQLVNSCFNLSLFTSERTLLIRSSTPSSPPPYSWKRALQLKAHLGLSILKEPSVTPPQVQTTYLPTHLPNQPTNHPTPTPYPTAQPISPPYPLSHQNNLPISYPLPQPLPSFLRVIPTWWLNPHTAHGKPQKRGGGSENLCAKLWLAWGVYSVGEMDVWGEGRGGCGVGRSWRGEGRGYRRGWVLLLPTVNMLEVDYCSRDMR